MNNNFDLGKAQYDLRRSRINKAAQIMADQGINDFDYALRISDGVTALEQQFRDRGNK